MLKLAPLLLLAGCLTLINCSHQKKPLPDIPQRPAPIGFDEDQLSKIREKYFELIHTGRPGVDWRKIEASNVEHNILLKKSMRLLKANGLSETESFANGKLKGLWSERGSNNQAGSVIASDYDSVNNNLYVISSGGSLWKNTGLTPNSWTLINDNYIFNNSMLNIVNKPSGDIRIIASINSKLSYSDDNSASFTPATVAFPVDWAGNNIVQIVQIKGVSNIIYLLCYIWDDNSWSSRLALYRSTNNGSSFSRFYTFSHDNASYVKLLNPYNSNSLFFMDCKSSANNIRLYQVSGTAVTLLNTTTQPETIAANPQISGTLIGSVLNLYLMNNNKNIYNSTDYGHTWSFMGSLPQNSWNRLDVSNEDASKVYAGGVEAMRSYNSGVTWSVVNGWGEYYGNINGKLHADIMNITNYRTTAGTSFMIINTHGGVAISYDNLTTTNNLSITGLHSAQYYDILTALDNDNIIYGGTQDQGTHKTMTAHTPGLLDFTQVISGDFGYLTLADIYRTFYTEYPGGNLYVYNHNTGGYIKNWTMPGSQKPNYGWMLPIKNTYNPVSDTILMAGGNLTGGGGSYLCRIAMPQSAGYAVYTSQYNYNFRANSTNGNAGITAIEVSPSQPERMYVATEDGTFFYTPDAGSNWNKSATFSVGGGWYLYGSTILSSRLTENLVWYGGSGYGGSPVFKSTDGGKTFVSINDGLPQTLVHEMVTNLNESMIFAATDAGPYVYIVDENKWYPMIGAENPIQSYTAVEYLSASNTARFATYGRGIFDFKISEPVVYYFFGNGNWDNPQNWVNGLVPPAVLTGNHEVFISPNGECILNTSQTISNGAKLTIAKNKKITITGELNRH